MPHHPTIIEALRLPALYRQTCLCAGVPLPPAAASADHFTLRCGGEPPGLLAGLLEEAFVDDGAGVVASGSADRPDHAAPGQIVVLPGFGGPCPAEADLRSAASPGGGPTLLLALERRDTADRLVNVTWVALPEEEPPPSGRFRAALLQQGVE